MRNLVLIVPLSTLSSDCFRNVYRVRIHLCLDLFLNYGYSHLNNPITYTPLFTNNEWTDGWARARVSLPQVILSAIHNYGFNRPLSKRTPRTIVPSFFRFIHASKKFLLLTVVSMSHHPRKEQKVSEVYYQHCS